MKVYLQYPWKFPDSPYYKSLIKNSPKGITYLNAEIAKEGATSSLSKFLFSNFIKTKLRLILRLIKNNTPNAHLTKSDERYDLIHCAHCLSKNDSPWVADIEGVFSLQLADDLTKKGKENIKKIILNNNCKKVIPWTKSIEKNILKEFPEIKNKLKVIYPAVPEIKDLNKPNNKQLKIIYVSRYFNLKGGEIALKVLDRLEKEYKIKGIVISDVPNYLKKKYKNLEIHNLLPQKKLFKLMEESDLFLYPSIVDTFGFCLLEAMSFGLPIVTLNSKKTECINEIVTPGKNGYIYEYESNYLDKLFKGCGELILNKELRLKMSKNCLKEIKEGKFSINKRNKELNTIYLEALK